MKLDLLTHFCRLQSAVCRLPYTIYCKNEIVFCSTPVFHDFDLLTPALPAFMNNKLQVNYFITDHFLIFGYVRNQADHTMTLIGPGAIGVFTEDDIDHIVLKYKKKAPLEEQNILKNYLLEMPIMAIENFLNALCTATCFINQEILTPSVLLTKGVNENIRLKTQIQLVHMQKKAVYETNIQPSYKNHEDQISFYIKNGMTDSLKDVLTTVHYEVGKLGSDELRHFKNAAIILNSLSLRAAMAGGLNTDICYKLGGLYIQQLEACKSIEQLSNISNAMVLDYCTRVQNETSIKTNDEIVNQCMNYIEKNCHEKITVPVLAEKVGISPEYLSSKFKKVTGRNLPSYINEKKIQEAKKLLVFTTMSLSEISEHLSFSNQSYFQAIFKNITGKTPLSYRKDYKNGLDP